MKGRLPTILRKNHVKKILNNAGFGLTGKRYRAFFGLMYYAGLRVHEATGLEPKDVDWDNGYIRINQGKGGKDRVIPIDPELAPILFTWEKARDVKERYYVHGPHGRMSDRAVQRKIKRVAEGCGIDAEAVTPHKLRHSFATQLLQDGFTISEVQLLLGHASIATTEVYLHVVPETLKEKVLARRGVK